MFATGTTCAFFGPVKAEKDVDRKLISYWIGSATCSAQAKYCYPKYEAHKSTPPSIYIKRSNRFQYQWVLLNQIILWTQTSPSHKLTQQKARPRCDAVLLLYPTQSIDMTNNKGVKLQNLHDQEDLSNDIGKIDIW